MNGGMAVLSVAVLMLSGLCCPSQSLLHFLFLIGASEGLSFVFTRYIIIIIIIRTYYVCIIKQQNSPCTVGF